MRWFAGILIFIVVILGGLYIYAVDIPFKKYSGWVTGKEWDRYFEVSNYRQLFLSPTELEEIPPYQEDYVQLWKEFPIRNTLIPLPTRHPLYQTQPIVDYKSKSELPSLGIILLSPEGREISRLYTLPNRLHQDHSQGQEIFKLPYFRKRILNKSLDELWRDIFSHKIIVEEKSFDEMIYDLYILHIRSRILPEDTVRYGMIKNGKQAMVELASKDKDYRVELVLTQVNGAIFSYILKTEINKTESTKLRSKFLESISFTPIDEGIGRILYTEFKQMGYARQVDHEGMLYLFSAWSQNTDNSELLKEMINYLERGVHNKNQLKTLYNYAYRKYGKTFTNRSALESQDDPELDLQRKIEIEERNKRIAAEANSNKLPEVQELTPDEKMNLYLRKAKEADPVKPKDNEEMTVH